MRPGPNEKESRPIEVGILVVGRDPSLPDWVRTGLEGVPHRAAFIDELPEGSSSESDLGLDPDLALVDEGASADFPDRLRRFKEQHPRCQILLLSQENSDLSPRRLRPVPIRHWFFRPVEVEELGRVLHAAGRSLQREWRELHRHRRELGGFDHLVGEHPLWIEALETAQKVAQSTDTSVLILGETGTGKGMLAKAIHAESPRGRGPYIEINCGAIPENLVESELFGHVKGAFTSAVRDKPGLLELADGGTAFFDEVGELELLVQSKILKFLDAGQIRRVQGTESIQVDVRMIAATNRDLEHLVGEKRFRLDLYHRLNVVTIELPPLRERPQDIELLANRYLGQLSQRIRGEHLEWTSDAMEALRQYAWPGNVRELINLTERLALITPSGGAIDLQDLPQEMILQTPVFAVEKETGTPLVELPTEGVSLRDVERSLVEAALARTGGNVTEAARLLRMSRGSLRYRLEKMGLQERASRRRGRPMRRRAKAA